MKKIKDQQITITIERPEGHIETVDVSEKIKVGNEEVFKTVYYPRIQKDTKAAGRGNVISYTFSAAEYEKEERDYVCGCERCRTKIDTRTAYSQLEWARFGGEKKQVIAYYCNDCKTLLSTIGMGEKTELEHKAAHVPSQEMINKEEMV